MEGYRVELLDKDRNVIDPMVDKLVGFGDHKVSATKEFNKIEDLKDKLCLALVGQVHELKFIPLKRERKSHKRLTLLQKKALRKDSKKLSVKELAAKYDVSLPTAKKYLS